MDPDPGYGPILQTMYIKDMECDQDFYTDYPAPNVTRKVYRYTMTSPAMPSFIYNLSYYTVNTPYDELIAYATNDTQGYDLIAHYEYDLYILVCLCIFQSHLRCMFLTIDLGLIAKASKCESVHSV